MTADIENPEIRFLKIIQHSEFRKLYRDAGWWHGEYDADTSFIDGIVSGSFCLAGLFLGDEMIGMGRAISDGASDAYIQDVVVLREYRGKGFGKKIISALIDRLHSANIDWIGLVAQPGTEPFYKSLGFGKMKEHVPMLYSHFPPKPI